MTYALIVDANTAHEQQPVEFKGMFPLIKHLKLARPLDFDVTFEDKGVLSCVNGTVDFHKELVEDDQHLFQFDIENITDALHGEGFYEGMVQLGCEQPVTPTPKTALQQALDFMNTLDFAETDVQRRNQRLLCLLGFVNTITDPCTSKSEKIGAACLFGVSLVSPPLSNVLAVFVIAEGVRHRGIKGTIKRTFSRRSMIVSAIGIGIQLLP